MPTIKASRGFLADMFVLQRMENSCKKGEREWEGVFGVRGELLDP